MALVSAVSLSFASCDKEIPSEPEEEQPGQTDENDGNEENDGDGEQDDPSVTEEPEELTYSFSASADAGFTWDEADAGDIRLVSKSDDASVQTYEPEEYSITDGKLTFGITVPSDVTGLYGVYPSASVTDDYKAVFGFPSEYTLEGEGIAPHLMLLSGKIDLTDADPAVEIPVTFSLAGHLVSFRVYDSKDNGDHLEKITFATADGTPLTAESYVYDLASGTASVSGASSSSVSASFASPLDLSGVTSSSDAAVISVPVLPAESAGYTCTVTTDKSTYSFVSQDIQSWKAGDVTEYVLDLAEVRVPKKELVFHFTDKGVKKLDYQFSVNGGQMNTDYFIVSVDGTEDGAGVNSEPYYLNFDYEAVDESGNPVDWATAGRSQWNNSFDIFCQENTGNSPRTAFVNIYFRDTEEYEVTGTYKSIPPEYEEITDEEPVLSVKVIQLSGSVLQYIFVGKGVNPMYNYSVTLADASAGTISRDAWGWYGCTLDGADVNPDVNECGCYTDLTFQAYDQEGNEVQWLSGTVGAGNNRFVINYEENLTGNPRTAVLKVFYTGGGNYTVQTVKYINDTQYQTLTLQDPEKEPVYTLTVTQPGA